MEPVPVYAHRQKGHIHVGWSCPTCGHITLERSGCDLGKVSWSWNVANNHCNQKCRDCGTTVQRGRVRCVPCSLAQQHQEEERRFAQAPRVQAKDYPGPVFEEGSGMFFASVQEMQKWCADNSFEPVRVRTCARVPIQYELDELVGVLERAGRLEEAHLEELMLYLERWKEHAQVLLLGEAYLTFEEVN